MVESRQREAQDDGGDARHLEDTLGLAQYQAREECGPHRHRREDDAKYGGARKLEPDRCASSAKPVAHSDRKDVGLPNGRILCLLRGGAPIEELARIHQHHPEVPIQVGQLRQRMARTLIKDELHADAPPDASSDEEELGPEEPRRSQTFE